MKWWRRWSTTARWSSLRRFVNYSDRSHSDLSDNQPHSSPPLTKADLASPLYNKGLRLVKLPLLLLFLTIAIISACSSTGIKYYSKILTPKPPLTPCRVVQHAMGEACVPNNPKRVVTISYPVLAQVLSLGIKPIASTGLGDREFGATYLNPQNYPALSNRVKDIKNIGNQTALNLEKILQLKPDLILDGVGVTSPLLSQIAPTVSIASEYADLYVNWKEAFNVTAKILGKEAEAQEAWSHYTRRIEQLKLALGSRYQNQTISIAITFQQNIFIYVKNSFAGSILDDLGLQRPSAQNVSKDYGRIDSISEENLNLIDGDILFLLGGDNSTREAFERLQKRPLWQTLTAVQNKKVYFVYAWTWNGINLLDADAVIDDLYKYLVNTP